MVVDTYMDIITRGSIAALLPCLFVPTSSSMAAAGDLAWGGELYGGRYYDDSRIGAYFVSSTTMDHGATVIGELLYEDYADYEFAGVGAHFLWPVGDFGDFGFVVSQAWETYEFEPGSDTDYETRTLAVEWELENGPLVVAAQAGKFLKDYTDDEPSYVSADIYYWGSEYDWYLRGAVRRISDDSLHIIEGYRVFDLGGRSITGYVGISADELDSAAPGDKDAVYAGGYAEIFTSSKGTLTLWVEASREDNDTWLTIELNFAFGPGARTPYITAFGFSLDN